MDKICETCINIETGICDNCYRYNEYCALLPCEFISDYLKLEPNTQKLIQDIVHCLLNSK